MTHQLTLFGIKNCDTVRKARRFLDQQGITYHFHDWRSDGVDAATLAQAADALGWDALVNRRSTTWRLLDEATRAFAPAQLLAEHPTLIKRPLLRSPAGWLVGFKDSDWQAHLAKVAA